LGAGSAVYVAGRYNIMSKKKLKFKKRRHLNTDQLFKKKIDQQLMMMDWSIRKAFPDPVERQKYIRDLIAGLEKEETCENM